MVHFLIVLISVLLNTTNCNKVISNVSTDFTSMAVEIVNTGTGSIPNNIVGMRLAFNSIDDCFFYITVAENKYILLAVFNDDSRYITETEYPSNIGLSIFTLVFNYIDTNELLLFNTQLYGKLEIKPYSFSPQFNNWFYNQYKMFFSKWSSFNFRAILTTKLFNLSY